jgi:hypothetical protein
MNTNGHEEVRIDCTCEPGLGDLLCLEKLDNGEVLVTISGSGAVTVRPVSIVIAALTLAEPAERARIKREVACL